MNQKRTALAAVALMACLLPLAAQAKDSRMAIVAPDDQAVIVYCEGLVKADGKAVDTGSRIADGATVVTGPDAIAEIVFGSRNIIRIKPGSVVTLNLSGLQKSATVEQGAIGAVLRRLDKAAGGTMSVRTPTATAAVRGTTFFLSVDGYQPDSTYLCTCNGRIELGDAAGADATIQEASHHKGTLRTAAGEGEAKPYGHNDADMETLAARIGETIDWTTVEN